jgi:hypothetical protein
MGVFLAFAVIAVACGDDDDDDGGSGIGPGADLPEHVASVSPEHGAVVTNQELGVGGMEETDGICASFSFQAGEGLGEEPTDHVQMLLNREDVSGSVSWVVTDDFPTSQGTGCYRLPDELPDGVHEAAVRYSDVAGSEFEYTWQFEVEG